jgi:hypothetical protein
MLKSIAMAIIKKTIPTYLVILVLSSWPTIVTAKGQLVRIIVNGNSVLLPDEEPFTDDNGRVQVPLRFVSEALGGKVEWNNTSKAATVSLDEIEVELIVGKQAYTINGQLNNMDTTATLRGGRAFVPLRFVAEALGAKVNWGGNAIYIDTAGIGHSNPALGGKVNYNGFIVDPQPASKLIVAKGPYDTLGSQYALLFMIIEFDTQESYEKQCADVEGILLQKIDNKTVTAVMNYLRTKSNAEDILKFKEFTGTNYLVDVMTRMIDGKIGITVFKK